MFHLYKMGIKMKIFTIIYLCLALFVGIIVGPPISGVANAPMCLDVKVPKCFNGGSVLKCVGWEWS